MGVTKHSRQYPRHTSEGMGYCCFFAHFVNGHSQKSERLLTLWNYSRICKFHKSYRCATQENLCDVHMNIWVDTHIHIYAFRSPLGGLPAQLGLHNTCNYSCVTCGLHFGGVWGCRSFWPILGVFSQSKLSRIDVSRVSGVFVSLKGYNRF